jgi:hypothetical protein
MEVGGLFAGQGTLEVQSTYLGTHKRKILVSMELEAQNRFQEMEKYGKWMHELQNGVTIAPQET